MGGGADNARNLAILISEMMPEVLRITSRCLLTPGIANVSLYPRPDWILGWFTPAGAGSGPWGFCCWQPILAYGKCPYLSAGLGRRADAFVHTEISERNGHPCPKPIEFWKKVLLRVSISEGETILDPFLGSGTTAVAAKKLGRHFLGFEINPDYVKIAQERIARVEAQPDLFDAKPPETAMLFPPADLQAGRNQTIVRG